MGNVQEKSKFEQKDDDGDHDKEGIEREEVLEVPANTMQQSNE